MTNEAILIKMMPPLNTPASQLVAETGILDCTLYTWRKEFRLKEVSFKTLVELMRGYQKAPKYPTEDNCWLISFSSNFKTGVQTVHNLHFSTLNKNRYRKYWQMALKVAGFK